MTYVIACLLFNAIDQFTKRWYDLKAGERVVPMEDRTGYN